MIHGREKARDVDYLNGAGWARPRSGAWAPDRRAREGRSENLGRGLVVGAMEATGERDIEVCCDQSISTCESVVAEASEASEATPRGAAWREVR